MTDIKLFDHQVEDLEFLASHDRAAIWHVVGAGKSFPLILDMVRALDSEGGHALVLTEAALPEQLKGDIHTMAPHITVSILTGTMKPKEKKAVIKDPGQVVIMNYEFVLSQEEFLADLNPNYIWCDEAHRIKGFRGYRSKHGKRSKIIMALASRAKYRRLSSGSPVVNPNNPDVWALYYFLDQGIFGKSLSAFEREFFYDISRPGVMYKKLQLKPSMKAELSRRMYLVARRLTFDDLKSKGVVFPERDVPIVHLAHMPTKVAKMYREMEKETIVFLEDTDEVITRPMILGRLMTLQQMASGYFIERPALDPMGLVRDATQKKVIHVDSSHKDKLVVDILQNVGPDMSVIIWAVFTHEIDNLCRIVLKERGGFARADGQRTGKAREKDLSDFKAGVVRTLIAHPGACGAGLNLQIAGHSIRYSRSPRLIELDQSRGRNHRAGTQFHERIFEHEIVTPGTRDEMMQKALLDKVDLSSEITLDHMKGRNV